MGSGRNRNQRQLSCLPGRRKSYYLQRGIGGYYKSIPGAPGCSGSRSCAAACRCACGCAQAQEEKDGRTAKTVLIAFGKQEDTDRMKKLITKSIQLRQAQVKSQ